MTFTYKKWYKIFSLSCNAVTEVLFSVRLQIESPISYNVTSLLFCSRLSIEMRKKVPWPWCTACSQIWGIVNGSCIYCSKTSNAVRPIWTFLGLHVPLWPHLRHIGCNYTKNFREAPKDQDKPNKNQLYKPDFCKSCGCNHHLFLQKVTKKIALLDNHFCKLRRNTVLQI